MNIKVLGYPWIIKVLKKKQFKKLFGKCSAITLIDKQEIYFRDDKFDKLHVIHELTHAFLSYSCTDELDLDRDQSEELFCDFMAIHGEAVLKLAKEVLR